MYFSLLRTTTRMDGMLWGALAAVLWPWLRPLRSGARDLVVLALLGLLIMTLWLGNSPLYMRWVGVCANLCVTAFIVAVPWLEPGSRLQQVLSWRPAAVLGRWSLALYVWHYPIFFFVARHLGAWPAPAKVLVAVTSLTVVVLAVTRWVERPIARVVLRRSARGRAGISVALDARDVATG